MKKDRYQELFDKSADAHLIIVGDKFVDCNAATVKMLGYKDKHELLNTHPSQLSPEFQSDGQLSYVKANEMMSIALEKGSHRFEWEHMRADRDVFPVEVLLTPIPEDNEKSLHVVWRDITDRKKAETALRESRDQLDAIFNSTKDGILVADVQSKSFWTGNRAICEMLGYTIDEIVTLKVDDIHPVKDLSKVVRKFEKQARLEIDLAGEIPVLRKDKTVFLADISTSLVSIGGKKSMIGIFRDVTERKEFEEKARHAQKLEAIGTLAGGIAHDLNNILSIMLGYSELAIEKLPSRSEVKNDIEEVIRAGNRAKELIKKILTFGRHSTSGFSILKIQSSVLEVLELLRATLPTTIEIRQEINSNCGSVRSDETQIHQVLMNLCTNAFHAMEDTGGTLDVRLQEVDFTDDDDSSLHGLLPGKYLKLEVSDNGPGIKEEIIGHIFDPYFTTKPQEKGSGLGLAVVYGIVKDHGGTITVESRIGFGTTFEVLLPVAEGGDTKTKIEIVSQGKTPGGNERILFVDDEEAIAVLGQNMLDALGYTVRYETNSKVALEMFRENPQNYDLVITDQTMPHLSGSELSKELMRIRPDIPIILCTGYSSMISEQKAKDMGIETLLMKPVNWTTLAQTVRNVIDAKN